MHLVSSEVREMSSSAAVWILRVTSCALLASVSCSSQSDHPPSMSIRGQLGPDPVAEGQGGG